MATFTTNGIKVSIKATYSPEHSEPKEPKFVFSYKVRIQNKSRRRVQLMRRHWYIFDSFGLRREVEGEGVIGEQPMLNAGEIHEYQSWSSLVSDMGKMHGTFLMVDMATQEHFEVRIPDFNLVADFRKN